jgi:DNA-binding NarL/FixJ family response regulator
MITFDDFKKSYPEQCQQRVRVVIGDDSLQGRAGMEKLMHQPPVLEVAGVAGNARALVQLCDEYHPTVAVLDLCFPLSTDGLAACRQLLERFPNLPVLVVTGHEQERAKSQVKAAGAKGYAIKNFSDGLLWKCVLLLAAGKEAFPNPHNRWLPAELDDAQRVAKLARCKPGELRLLAALARITHRRGFQLRGAIKQLAIEETGGELLRGLAYPATERVARDILEQLRKKLNFNSSVEAAQWYAQAVLREKPSTEVHRSQPSHRRQSQP